MRCRLCKYYGEGYGEAECIFCDPEFDDRFEPASPAPGIDDEDKTEQLKE